MSDLVYTDREKVEQGVITSRSFDLAYGADENDFELTLPIDFQIDEGALVYIDGTEWGGVVRGYKESTLTEVPTYIAIGQTWHGILAHTFICPTGDYETVSGEANSAMSEMIAKAGLTEIFDVSSEDSGIEVSHQFERFGDVYTGFCQMLANAGAKLRIEKKPDSKPVLSAVEISDYTDFDGTNRYGYELSYEKPVNHLICLGQGELSERTVIHLYADADGAISQTQSLFGLDERQEVYDYNNADDDELLTEGTKRLEELQSTSSCELKLPEDMAFDIGDKVGIVSEKTGKTISAFVTKTIVSITPEGTTVTNEIGEITMK